MKSHIIPTNKILKQLPFTYGTKNLKSNNSPEVIAREIIIPRIYLELFRDTINSTKRQQE